MSFSVNTEVCIRCNMCVAECPTGLLKMSDNGPVAGRGSCIACGHCVAVCPTEAIDYDLTPRAEQTKIGDYTLPTPEEAERFMRYRRSIRIFKDKEVPKEDIMRLLKIASMAPTATNSQGISYRVIQDREQLQAISRSVMDWMHEMGKENGRMRLYAMNAERYNKTGRDFILHKAPALVLALSKDSGEIAQRGRDNGHFCLSYAELFAPTLGLGSCWSGFVEFCAQAGYEPVLEKLGLPDGYRVAGAIMVGYPQYKYRYMPEREPLQVFFDEEV